jgi:hypothetical protein
MGQWLEIDTEVHQQAVRLASVAEGSCLARATQTNTA